MTETAVQNRALAMAASDLSALIGALREEGYRVIGPTVRDGAILYEEIASADDLPQGWSDEQGPAVYSLHRRDDGAYFEYTVGPHAWKRFLHPPRVRLFRSVRTEQGFRPEEEPKEPPRFAFLGVRACELKAIAIQDRVFLGGSHIDPTYAENRQDAFIVAVNCTRPGGTCFCASTNTGPRADAGYDLALTELRHEGRHEFLVETGSERGLALMSRLPHRESPEALRDAARRLLDEAAHHMGRGLNTVGLKEILHRSYDHPRWRAVEHRCLTCGNCTMVCPTCFCTTVDDVTDLGGAVAERWRRWDSCFTTEFSFIHGGSVRTSISSRYRQWLTHKLATWQDQFNTLGCVGCGRCITWCPAGIDITEEAAAIRASEDARTPTRRERGAKP